MSKPTLEQLKYYLDAGLNIIHGSDIFTVTGLSNDKIMFKGGFVELSDERTKYFLRPMSDLCKPITIDGEEKIPIVELFKIAFPDLCKEKTQYKVSETFEWVNVYNEGTEVKWFCMDVKGDFRTLNDSVPNQLALFAWLFKHKFDVFNGIGTWAIDVNTLTENIY